MCLGLEPAAAEWKAQTNPLSYDGGIPFMQVLPIETKALMSPLDIRHYNLRVLTTLCIIEFKVTPSGKFMLQNISGSNFSQKVERTSFDSKDQKSFLHFFTQKHYYLKFIQSYRITLK